MGYIFLRYSEWSHLLFNVILSGVAYGYAVSGVVKNLVGWGRGLSSFSFMLLAVFLTGCVSGGLAGDDLVSEVEAGVERASLGRSQELGLAGLDLDDSLVVAGASASVGGEGGGGEKFDGRVDRFRRLAGEGRNLEGDDFDPNRAAAPNYRGVLSDKVAKRELLEELMRSAYESYRELTGRLWYPREVRRGGVSGDPLLRADWWQLPRGGELRAALEGWGRKANWRVVWRSRYHYPIEVGAVFKGSFYKAVTEALEVFADQGPRLYAVFYKNRVVVFRNESKRGEGERGEEE